MVSILPTKTTPPWHTQHTCISWHSTMTATGKPLIHYEQDGFLTGWYCTVINEQDFTEFLCFHRKDIITSMGNGLALLSSMTFSAFGVWITITISFPARITHWIEKKYISRVFTECNIGSVKEFQSILSDIINEKTKFVWVMYWHRICN